MASASWRTLHDWRGNGQGAPGCFQIIGPSREFAQPDHRGSRHRVATGYAGIEQVLVAGDELLVVVGREEEAAAIFVLEVFDYDIDQPASRMNPEFVEG